MRLIDADALISECGYFKAAPTMIDPDVLLENGGDLSSICSSTTVEDIIEKQPVMICETIKDAKMHEIGVFEIIDDFRDHIKEDLAKEIGYAMMKKGMITFDERQSSDGMLVKITATANIVTQMPKDGEKE